MINNKLTRELADALFKVEPERVSQLLKVLPADCDLPSFPTGLDYWVYIPLHYISVFVDLAIGDPETFCKDESKNLAQQTLARNRQIKTMLAERFGVDFSEEIPFNNETAILGTIYPDYRRVARCI